MADGHEDLRSGLEGLDEARVQARRRLAADPAQAGHYGELVGRLRELCIFDPRQGEPSAKAFAKAARAAAAETRSALALLGPGDGLARGIMKHMALLDLGPEERYLAALACAQADAEQTLTHLEAAGLPDPERVLDVALLALGQQPVLDFAEFKTLETLYQSVEPGAPDAREVQRRYEQARGRRAQHAHRHLLALVPEPLRADPAMRQALLGASLARDPFGTLDHLRQAAGGEPFAGLSPQQRLGLLERVADFGLGLASTHLDLFAIPPGPVWHPRLQRILRQDLTAGSTILGVHALEGIQHYPFGLGHLEPVLPRRITSAEALAYLRKGEEESAKPRAFTSAEMGAASDRLQQLEVQRFLEGLKSDIGREWKACVGDRKLGILFADPGLKIRNILFLLGQALFEPEEGFETIYRSVQKSHPMSAGDLPRILLLANRYYFLDQLGLNPGLLFNRGPRPAGGARTFIEEAGDYPVRAFLHTGMSIHLRVGGALFRSAPIAWSILAGQYEGRIDTVLQELTFLFDGFDTLFTIAAADSTDLEGWLGPLIAALQEDAAELPEETLFTPSQPPLRLTTRAAIDRCRERLNHYCLQALQRSARAAGVSPVNIIQGLHLPRARIDKLRTMLDQERRAAPR